ncbi:hypothetical protein [Allonocardiopsis opalescens]|uniref:hypothetical protein n=1 Tax=Allonocardiopsis opalescens TaxID=1144618 RepID=UPI00147382CB|nr:hypothetical protein [Allonocardiopsis opalescens]
MPDLGRTGAEFAVAGLADPVGDRPADRCTAAGVHALRDRRQADDGKGDEAEGASLMATDAFKAQEFPCSRSGIPLRAAARSIIATKIIYRFFSNILFVSASFL